MKKIDVEKRLASAVQAYWLTRSSQGARQGVDSTKDYKERASVTGGKQMDAFAALLGDLLIQEGVEAEHIFFRDRKKRTIPGFFRPTKDWDLIVIAERHLWLAVELKSQVGPSFGNNYNNRVEEGIGNASDLRTAFRENTFGTIVPWVGYLLLLEDCADCHSPVRASEEHFPIRPEFRQPGEYEFQKRPISLSYARRYEMFCRKLVLEKLYDASCFLISSKSEGLKGRYSAPAIDFNFQRFVTAMSGKVHEYLVTLGKR